MTKDFNNFGVHIFEQTTDLNWESEIVLFNLLSALSWKRFHGPINLYCNSRYLETLKKWNVDKVYDQINTDFIDTKPDYFDYKQYWALVKLLVIEKLSLLKQKFTVLDTDLWLNARIDLNKNCDVIMYHKEDFDNLFPKNVYPDFDDLIPSSIKNYNFDKKILPTNCGILHFNTTNFIEEWINIAKIISISNQSIPTTNKSTKMCLVEQRILPMLLSKKGLKYETFIDQIYLSHKYEAGDGSEWSPRLDQLSEEESINFEKIKHVWGLKRFFTDSEVRIIVVGTALKTLQNYDTKEYSELIDKLWDSVPNPLPSFI